MRYLITYTAPGRDLCREIAETPVQALQSALRRKHQGFANIVIWDHETGEEYEPREFRPGARSFDCV